ncbi:MAG TPA: hypothetical protein V6C52_06505 [Coleofasciculaceae cyanobacterium]
MVNIIRKFTTLLMVVLTFLTVNFATVPHQHLQSENERPFGTLLDENMDEHGSQSQFRVGQYLLQKRFSEQQQVFNPGSTHSKLCNAFKTQSASVNRQAVSPFLASRAPPVQFF